MSKDSIRPDLRAPNGGWQVPKVRQWVPKTVQALTEVLPQRSVYCAGSPMHKECVGYDPQTKKRCSCSCHRPKDQTE